MRKDDGSGIFILILGAVVAALVGYAAYKIYMDSQQTAIDNPPNEENLVIEEPKPEYHTNLDQLVDYIENLPLERNPIANQHPNEYYLDANVINPVAMSCPQSESVVENDESVTWTDWAGRERNISITRKVR